MKSSKPILQFGKESVDKYKELNLKVFEDQLSNKELFFLAVGFGVYFAQRVEKFEKSSTGPRTELNDDDLYLLSAVALAEQASASELPADDIRNETAIQYAEGGIRLIFDFISDKAPAHARAAFLNEFNKTLS